MRTKITCCFNCVAPVRHQGCKSTCPRYLEQKAEFDAYKEMVNKEKADRWNANTFCRDTFIRIRKRKRTGR